MSANDQLTKFREQLDRVFFRTSELTIDCADMSEADREMWLAEARTRGLHVSGTKRWLLIRRLEQ